MDTSSRPRLPCFPKRTQAYLCGEDGDNGDSHSLHVDVVGVDEALEHQLAAALAIEMLDEKRKGSRSYILSPGAHEKGFGIRLLSCGDSLSAFSLEQVGPRQ